MGLLQVVAGVALVEWPWLVALGILLVFVTNNFNHGLHKYPGPFLAGITNLWRFADVCRRRPQSTQIQLHWKYGDIVRLGPNVLSFADPKAIKDIYGLNKGFIKSGFYPVQQAMVNGKRLPSLFSTVDEGYHAQLRRCVNSAFAMSALVQYEPGVDVITELFLQRTEELFAKKGKACNFTLWLQYYAFDVIGQVTYSKSHGFIERNEDVDGIVKFLRETFDYVAPVGQMPWLDLVLWKNPALAILDRLGVAKATSAIVDFARARLSERLQGAGGHQDVEKRATAINQPDLLSKFLKAQEDRPDFFDDTRVLTMAVSMAFAGSETTAISLAAVFYFLLKNPSKHESLMHELEGALESGKVECRTNGLVSWSESQSLPYLDACIKEAFRLFPAAGLALERVTPAGGAVICGEHIAGGTIVGCNAWVIHRRQDVWGPDVDVFRPERWLHCTQDRRRQMEGTMFQFGAGSRTCIGKNISLLEIYKLVPAFLLRFKLAHAGEWRPHNAWFVRQENFHTTFELRQTTPKHPDV